MLEMAKGISQEKSNNVFVFMGLPGSGKTTVAGTFPKPMLYVSIGDDGGGVVLKGYSDDEVKTLNLATDKSGTSCAKLKTLLTELKGNKTFKTVVIDAYTSIQEEMEAYFTMMKGGKALNFDEWDAVGKQLLSLRDMIVANSKEGVNYVLVCHVKTKDMTDTITNEVSKTVIPKMTGNNGRILLERADVVAYCCRKTIKDANGKMEVKFLTYLGAHPNIDTKFRTPNRIFEGVGTYVEDCTYDKMMALAKGKSKLETVNVVETQTNPFGSDENEGE